MGSSRDCYGQALWRFCWALGAMLSGLAANAVDVTLSPSKDATIYESSSGNLANGAGSFLYAGRTTSSSNSIRRALLAFDIAGSIPAGATITNVELRLTVTRRPSNPFATSFQLYKASRAWSEGTSTPSTELSGTSPETGDSTWRHTSYNTQFWTTSGGDFSATSSLSLNVDATGQYLFTSAQMIADVQSWVDNPSANFGWFLRGDESSSNSYREFASRQRSSSGQRPSLLVSYTTASAPAVSSITRVGATPTNAGSASFTVTFNQSVTGVNSSDFTLATAGISGAGIASVSGSGATYTVTVNTGTGDGTLRLDVTDNDSIVNSSSQPLGGAGAGNGNFTSGQSYTIDKTRPTIALSSFAASVVNTGITVTVTLGESATGFTAGDITPTNASVSGFTGSGTSYSFTLTPIASGTFSASVAAGAFLDLASNTSTASNTLSRMADLTAPTIALSSAAAGTVNHGIAVSAVLSEASTNFAVSDIAVTNATVSGFSGSGGNYTFTLTPAGEGAFGASVNAGAFTDAAGNANTASNSLSRVADLTPPAAVLSSSAAVVVNSAITVSVSLTEASTSFTAQDISTANATLSAFSGSGTAYSFTLNPIADGAFGATVNTGAFTDAAGNLNAGPATITRTADRTAPGVTLSTSANEVVNGAITVTVNTSEPTSDLTSDGFSLTNATISSFAGAGNSYSFQLSPVADGAFGVRVNAATFTDAAGNGNTASNDVSRSADLTAPTVTLQSSAEEVVNHPIVIDVTLSEDAEDLTVDDFTLSNALLENFSGSGGSYQFSLTPLADGVFSATLDAAAFTDAVGNSNASGGAISRLADFTAPQITLASNANAKVNGPIEVQVELTEPSGTFDAQDLLPENATVEDFTGSGASYSFTLSPLAEGDFGASVTATAFTDSAGNAGTASNALSRVADFTRPGAALSSGAASTVVSAIIVKVNLTEPSENFTAIDITPVNATVSLFGGSGSAYFFALTPTESGTFGAAMEAGVFTDAAGNPNTASNVLTRTADTSQPGALLGSGAPEVVNAGIAVSVELTKPSDDFDAEDITTTNATVDSFSGTGASYTFTLVPLSDGQFSAFVAAGAFTDTSGILGLASNTLTRMADLTAPTATLSSNVSGTVQGSILVTVTLSEAAVGFGENDIVTSNAIATGFNGGDTLYQFVLSPVAVGDFTVQIPPDSFTDAVGNNNLASNGLVFTFAPGQEGEGVAEGEGSAEGDGEAASGGYSEVLARFVEADGDGNHLVSFQEIEVVVTAFSQELFNAADTNDDSLLNVAELLERNGPGILHSADVTGNSMIELEELLRMVQLYNAGAYACAPKPGDTEDGYLARSGEEGDPACLFHAADANEDGVISLSELLRAVQIFNIGAYRYCPGEAPDGFCPVAE